MATIVPGALYPDEARQFTTKVDFVDIVLAEHVNTLQNEVRAIQLAIGTNITTSSGFTGTFTTTTENWPTLQARLANIERGIVGDAHTQYVKKVGGDIITSPSASFFVLGLKGVSGQTGDLLAVFNSSNQVIARISSEGRIYSNGVETVTLTGAQTLANKVMSGSNNTFSNVPHTAVVIAGSTPAKNIKTYIDETPGAVWGSTPPNAQALGLPAGTIWIDSDSDPIQLDVNLVLSKTEAASTYVTQTGAEAAYLRQDAPSPDTSTDGFRRSFASTSDPSGGDDGDVWFKYI